ncbi:ATP-dependent endonuclease [Jeotgalibaca sp. PTS2502]|uniref:ATP-dependent nuclease n=1 Tax=Jeotgalibaca sp. PTS2502 TaxID=1903686 RepID=UPI000973D9FB|nr:AAA family ATPase [Jeotgalibaca sp. PTS2502]APZ50152.1 ATP-dependent endonuclease [Jeotgalibaca sp. PTS2502]
MNYKPFISKVTIKNFRNFKSVSVDLSRQHLLIGENNVGKSNFIKAIQLILDPSLSEEERYLKECDFNESILNPMDNKEIIEISIEIQNYEKNNKLFAMLSDACISNNPNTIKLTYRYFPQVKDNGKQEYEYIIFQGNNEHLPFGYRERKYLNAKVIPALRDTEKEIRNIRKSPINTLLKNYQFDLDELNLITEELKNVSSTILDLEEVKHLLNMVNSKFNNIVSSEIDLPASFSLTDVPSEKLLSTLRIVLGEKQRGLSDTSLGINNLLYITLLLLSVEDNTVPYILLNETKLTLDKEENSDIIGKCYTEDTNGKFLINNDIATEDFKQLYSFMDSYYQNKGFHGFTILIVEEPEAHLHPTLQRTIYKEIFSRGIPLLFTTHSPHIASIAPIQSIVHFSNKGNSTIINSTVNIQLSDREGADLQRYIDVNRGDIYFGKGVILVEGIAEEYLIPKFGEALGYDFDKRGIICCNINSTNFLPYYKFLKELGIPTAIITDGDFYYLPSKEKKEFHKMDFKHAGAPMRGYEGQERMETLLVRLGKAKEEEFPENFEEVRDLLDKTGIFVGDNTLETDIFKQAHDEMHNEIIISIFNELTEGKDVHKENFKQNFHNMDFDKCLEAIEGSTSKIGKGRFAQTLSLSVNNKMIPNYIKKAIEYIENSI